MEWKNRWNNPDAIERLVFNERSLQDLKTKKLKPLKKDLKNIKKNHNEEKKSRLKIKKK